MKSISLLQCAMICASTFVLGVLAAVGYTRKEVKYYCPCDTPQGCPHYSYALGSPVCCIAEDQFDKSKCPSGRKV